MPPEDVESLLPSQNAREKGSGYLSLLANTAPSRRKFVQAMCTLTAVSLLGLLFFGSFGGSRNSTNIVDLPPPLYDNSTTEPPHVAVAPPFVDPFGAEFNLIGPPTNHFRGRYSQSFSREIINIYINHTDNLRSDRKYISSWISAGWSASLSFSFFAIPDQFLQPMM